MHLSWERELLPFCLSNSSQFSCNQCLSLQCFVVLLNLHGWIWRRGKDRRLLTLLCWFSSVFTMDMLCISLVSCTSVSCFFVCSSISAFSCCLDFLASRVLDVFSLSYKTTFLRGIVNLEKLFESSICSRLDFPWLSDSTDGFHSQPIAIIWVLSISGAQK